MLDIHVFSGMVELDVWLTSDDKVVVFHDQSLMRMTGIEKHITDMEYSKLPEMRTELVNIGKRVS